MKDVAELAGVSIKTVSRVLNNEPHVKETLQAKVREAVELLNYVPSQSARSLRGNRSYDIALICPNAHSNYINAIQFGAVVACQERGYQLSINLFEGLTGKPVKEIREAFEVLLLHRKPDAVMLVAPYADDPKIDAVLKELRLPAVRIGPVELENRGILVEIDDYQAAVELTEHLLDLGHRRIGFIRGIEEQRSAHVRYAGFCAALEARGLGVLPQLVRRGDFDFESGFKAGEYFLGMAEPPTAIFCSNDDMAAGVVAACNVRHVAVPQQLSVVGFDDADVATRMRPLLTTIRQPLGDLGATAVRELIGQLKSRGSLEPKRIVLDHEFVLRETTAPPGRR
ncbi:LacI family DNA-binding transcriptional regulator [Qipengyuania sp. 6B39]|uniref:LacI family DNA-binding transcriptional regulator n=1 Tax=Qipengyuania proteolytica TaxID=2867239 RepID=UPI001C88FC24|nr:LacI family DNA-binding transcriptional regulator [Qipengyuania proteolytica]MBX7495775.1 LacI family DNA-binding transcriptional regulator [Qipengyuania proteolytica]